MCDGQGEKRGKVGRMCVCGGRWDTMPSGLFLEWEKEVS